jgi:hypothetical protein
MRIGMIGVLLLMSAPYAIAGGIDFKKVGSDDAYENLPGVKTPPPVTTLGSKAKDCTTVPGYAFNQITGFREPILTYKCSQGNFDMYSTTPPVP